MGVPGLNDSAIYSANPDGSDMRIVVAPCDVIKTPGWITLDEMTRKLYFSDQEGFSIYRCDLDGLNLQTLKWTAHFKDPTDGKNTKGWRAGNIAALGLGAFCWRQKRSTKLGWIYSADGLLFGDFAGRLILTWMGGLAWCIGWGQYHISATSEGGICLGRNQFY
jgi:hypothetical protein